MRAARNWAIAMLGPALACACMSDTGRFDASTTQRFPVPADASPACVAAAQSASRWCYQGATVQSDATFSFNCTKAQWDYARSCQ